MVMVLSRFVEEYEASMYAYVTRIPHAERGRHKRLSLLSNVK